jgi:hypothetical protein
MIFCAGGGGGVEQKYCLVKNKNKVPVTDVKIYVRNVHCLSFLKYFYCTVPTF